MAAIFLVLFLVTFLFDTRIGLFFLGVSIVMLYKGGAGKRLAQARAMQSEPLGRRGRIPGARGKGTVPVRSKGDCPACASR